MNKKSIEDIDIKNKKVILRVDFNVPLSDTGEITNDKRIIAAIPTINYLLDNNCSVILISHLGRPKGNIVNTMSLTPVATYLKHFFSDRNVFMSDDCIGPDVKNISSNLKQGDILLLENLRFHKEEEKNDDLFAKELASIGDIFVQDAFGTVHRAHASTVGITKYLPSVAGLLVKKELEYLGNVLSNPLSPFLAILGGSKVSDKILVIENLLNKVDSLIIGGAMAYTFLKSKGVNIGISRIEEDKIKLAKDLLEKATIKGVKILLPIDHIIATEFSENSIANVTNGIDIPDGYMGLDIGPKTIDLFRSEILKSKTILNNGPMGVFEFKNFEKGTMSIANSLADATDKGSISIVGGGDSASAVKKSGTEKRISHVSTGGGASLEFLEGKILPGIDSLMDK